MPTPLILSYARKTRLPVEKVEAAWARAKDKAEAIRRSPIQDRQYWALVNGLLKKELGLSESKTSFLEILEAKEELKTLTIDELSRFKVDKRFSSIVQEWHDEKVTSIKSFLRGQKPVVSVIQGDYTVNIMPNHRKIIEKKGIKNPVPAGQWMGFWDPDLKPYVDKKTYDRASHEEQMRWDAQVQLDKYVPDQFFKEYAGFWLGRAYELWYWDENGKSMSWPAENEYWKKKITS